MSNLSTFYPAPITAADLGLGAGSNATFGSIQNTPIGSTTPAAGTFTTLSANNGTITASAPVLDLSQTWNNSGVTFTGLRFNITNTASAAASWLVDFQIGGSTQLGVLRTGQTVLRGVRAPVTTDGVFIGGQGEFNSAGLSVYPTSIRANRDAHFGWTPDTNHLTAPDLQLHRDAADTLAQRRTTNPQTFRLYNTFTDASNFERGFMRWSSNVLQIGTEKAGTGTGRNLDFQTDGATRFSIAANGNITVGGGLPLAWGGGATRIIGATFPSGLLQFQTGSTDRLTIDSNGIIGIGGTTSSFPALKRSSTALQVRLADDSADAPFSSGAITTSGHFSPSATNSFDIGTSSVRFRWGYFFTGIALGATSTGISSGSDGVIQLRNNNGADFGRLQFGGTTSSFPALKRSTTTIQVRLADDSGDAGLSCSTLTLSDNLTFGSGDNIVLSTTTGTQIGTATNQLLGFYGATPVDRPATVADPTGGGTVDAEARTAINDIIDRLQELGLIA